MDSKKSPNQGPAKSEFEKVENEYKKLQPAKLDKSERITKKRFSITNPGRQLPEEITQEEEPSDKPAKETEQIETQAPVPVAKKASVLSAFDDELLELDAFLLNKYHRKGYMFTPREYYKILWALGIFHVIGSLASFLTIIFAHFYFPGPTFVGKFQADNKVFGHPIIFILLYFEPIYAVILYYICCKRSRKNVKAIRIYYTVGTWLLLLLFVALMLVLSFASDITERNVVKELNKQMECYDDVHTSLALLTGDDYTPIDRDCKKAWDEIQNFYKCCGIHSYKDWYRVRGFWDPPDEKMSYYWLVPDSCCTSQAEDDLGKCTKVPEEHLEDIHKKSCLHSVIRLLEALATTYGVMIFINFAIQILTIIGSSNYHEILRFEDGTNYKMCCKTFFYELLFLNWFKTLKFKPSRAHYSQILPINATAEEKEIELQKQRILAEKSKKNEEEEEHRKLLAQQAKHKGLLDPHKGPELHSGTGAKGSSDPGHGQQQPLVKSEGATVTGTGATTGAKGQDQREFRGRRNV